LRAHIAKTWKIEKIEPAKPLPGGLRRSEGPAAVPWPVKKVGPKGLVQGVFGPKQ
jgi:hypothetical protein